MVLFILRHSSSRLVGAGVVLGKVLLPVLAELFGALLELTDGGGLQEAGPGSGATQEHTTTGFMESAMVSILLKNT